MGRGADVKNAVIAAVHLLLIFRWPVLCGLATVMAVANAASGESEWAVVCGIGTGVMFLLWLVERHWEGRRDRQ